MKTPVRTIHKYIGLCLGLLWLLQALSGMLLVFHRTLDDRMLGASGRPADRQLIDSVMRDIEYRLPGSSVSQYFPSGGIDGQIDLLVDFEHSGTRVIRIDAATGAIVRTSAWAEPASGLAFFRLVLLFHKQLLAGTPGHWLIGVSGAWLFTAIALGLKLAWPRTTGWRAALLPRPRGAPAAICCAWHRAIGLWFAPFGLLVALTGMLLVWRPELERLLGVEIPSPVADAHATGRSGIIPASTAIGTALDEFGGASLASVAMPTADAPWYRVTVRQPGELRRVFGTTVVFVDAHSAEVLASHDALSAPAARQFLMALWPMHSGEWGGFATRILALMIGAWLLLLIGFGAALWWTRRQARNARRPLAARQPA